MNSSLRKIINNFRAFLPTTLSQKMKVKKNLKKNIKQKKEEPCNSKNKKCFFGRIWLTYEKHSDPKSIISFGKAAISNGYIYIQKFSCIWILEIVLWFWTNIWPFYSAILSTWFFLNKPNVLQTRALPDITVRSGSPANFQSPDSPKTGRSPSRTPDFYHSKK